MNKKQNTKFDLLAEDKNINNAVENLKKRNFEAIVIDSKEKALEKIKELIPKGASIMNGSSETLGEIGFIDYLKTGKHGWNNLHEPVFAESDPVKQKTLREQALSAEYYLGSVHALSETGEMVVASNSGSQLPHLVFTSPNLILVVGSQKITADLNSAFQRLHEYVIPLEDDRALKAYGVHTADSKTLILHSENPMMGRKVLVMIVKEKLGF